jgi:hypothetical protein
MSKEYLRAVKARPKPGKHVKQEVMEDVEEVVQNGSQLQVEEGKTMDRIKVIWIIVAIILAIIVTVVIF